MRMLYKLAVNCQMIHWGLDYSGWKRVDWRLQNHLDFGFEDDVNSCIEYVFSKYLSSVLNVATLFDTKHKIKPLISLGSVKL